VRIDVACQTDQRFAADLAVMLHSLLDQNPEDSFVVHFLHDELLPSDDRVRLRSVVERGGAEWSPVAITAEVANRFPHLERYGGVTAWFRLLLPRLLGQLERVLYLDADLLVVGAVRELWQTDLETQCLGAVTQPVLREDARRVTRDLGLPHPSRYFNSGVMLMNLARLRDRGLMAHVEQVAASRSIPTPWADQDPLNRVLWKERLDLHPRWNVMNPVFDLPVRLLPWSTDQVAQARADPRIIHFIGPYKPWHFRLRHPYTKRYFDHLAQTPYAGRSLEGRTTRHRLLRPLPVRVGTQAEWMEHRVKRFIRYKTVPTLHGLARQVLSADPRLHGWARAAHRLVRPSAAPPPLIDVLEALADTRPDACFIQIGSNDADHGDPLRQFVQGREWRGVLVEPVPFVFERLRARFGSHPRITLVNAAIAGEDGQLPFYYVAQSDDPALPEWYDQLGSFVLENILHPYHLEHIPDLRDRIVCEEVPCLTFASLWRAHPLPRLDLLHIDAEGYDDQILLQVDLDGLRPTLVLYEHQHLDEARRSAIAEHLCGHGYQILDLGPDALAMRSDAELRLRLALRRCS
jgi:FkbM family methyltransferase